MSRRSASSSCISVRLLLAFLDDHVAGRAGAAAAAGVLERDAEVLRDVEKRFRLAVMRIRKLAVLELDGLRLRRR